MQKKDFINDSKLPRQRITQFQKISNNGEVIIDFVGRYENINKDFSYICRKLNIPEIELPITNKFDHQNYINYYTKEMVDEVNSFADDDFINFYSKLDI